MSNIIDPAGSVTRAGDVSSTDIIPCESCDSPATCTVRLSGPAGVDSFPACLACATDALMSARCSVRVVPFLAVAR